MNGFTIILILACLFQFLIILGLIYDFRLIKSQVRRITQFIGYYRTSNDTEIKRAWLQKLEYEIHVLNHKF